MFDIGFTEIALIGVVSLLVLGPERLPHAARMVGAWVGKIRRTFLSLQIEIEREVNANEIKQRLQEEAKASTQEIEHELHSLSQELNPAKEPHQDDDPKEHQQKDNDQSTAAGNAPPSTASLTEPHVKSESQQ